MNGQQTLASGTTTSLTAVFTGSACRVLLPGEATMESDMSFKCSSQDPLVTFGVLADVQYADHDDKPARYDPSMMRYYRNALNQRAFVAAQVRRAYDHWSRVPGLGFVLQLGDLIDEHNGGCHRGLDRVLEAMGPLPSYHTVGNHELYNCDRKDLARKYLQHRHTELPLDGGARLLLQVDGVAGVSPKPWCMEK
ncbi:hypothetical protein HPB47_024061 [Ixodes persulcatus]|uniref:Uncharacterized protein n=1 Tax=Ixodes persulcatus TaxID=34615 RepID=A0AC60Q5C4_IXOPE|nr:hypothetical protein HPB47_024061 [Ixodes persulcatus]